MVLGTHGFRFKSLARSEPRIYFRFEEKKLPLRQSNREGHRESAGRTITRAARSAARAFQSRLGRVLPEPLRKTHASPLARRNAAGNSAGEFGVLAQRRFRKGRDERNSQ